MKKITQEDVKQYWNKKPIGSTFIKFEPGTAEFFKHFDEIREKFEPPALLDKVHRFSEFKGKKVLDVGCGNGYILSKYAKKGAICYGVDITEKAIDISCSRFRLEGLNATFHVANAEELPFEDNTFDLVCSMGVLHHTLDTQKAIDEIYRILKPQGEVVLMLYHKNSAQYRLNLPFRALLRRKSIQKLLNELDGEGNPLGKAYTKSEAIKMLKNFKEVKIKIDFLWPYHFPIIKRIFPDKLLKPLLKPFAGWLGFYLYANGKK